jgi:hypothetical protein
MRATTLLATVTTAFALSGCFTAERPLLTDDNSVAPYQTVSFRSPGSEDAVVLSRKGKAYVAEKEGERATIRVAPIDRPNWFVLEFSDEKPDSKSGPYLALLKVDFAHGRAEAYKIFADKQDIGPGLRDCGNQNVCVDDLDAYVALAKRVVDAGAKPEGVYAITFK